jgi:hypothetical protein
MNTYAKMVGGYPGRSFYLVAPARHTPPASATACGSKVRCAEDRLRVPHPLALSWRRVVLKSGSVHAFGACIKKREDYPLSSGAGRRYARWIQFGPNFAASRTFRQDERGRSKNS